MNNTQGRLKRFLFGSLIITLLVASLSFALMTPETGTPGTGMPVVETPGTETRVINTSEGNVTVNAVAQKQAAQHRQTNLVTQQVLGSEVSNPQEVSITPQNVSYPTDAVNPQMTPSAGAQTGNQPMSAPTYTADDRNEFPATLAQSQAPAPQNSAQVQKAEQGQSIMATLAGASQSQPVTQSLPVTSQTAPAIEPAMQTSLLMTPTTVVEQQSLPTNIPTTQPVEQTPTITPDDGFNDDSCMEMCQTICKMYRQERTKKSELLNQL